MNAIEVKSLRKVYSSGIRQKEVVALQSLDLTVDPGVIYGLLGPNGAGKTTLIKILLGITHKTLGEANILGEDISNYQIRKKVGYLAENHKYPPFMKGEEILHFFAQLGGYDKPDLDQRINDLLKLVDMEKWRKTKLKNYSKGMLQRIGLAQALVNDPELVFLDEPTDGVDPLGRKEIRDIIKRMKDDGKTVFLNSHLLSEVELICDRVAVLNKGELITEGTVGELTSDNDEYKITLDSPLEEEFKQKATGSFAGLKCNRTKIIFSTKDSSELNSLIDLIRREEKQIMEITKQKRTLEDSFLEIITGKEGKNGDV
ncbi:MAG: ABC transporter ATP-binding protein [Melioribacteraceae bacterium]|nr:MAG: ABC transporter ATP-binding protein [Melioribacteraceae bacterium]